MPTTEERKIKILLDGKQVNASLKEMQGSAAVMNNQLAKMSANDPNRKKLLQDFKTMQDRIKATKTEIYGVQKASAGMGIGFKSAFAALAPLFAIQKVFSFLDDSTQKFNTQAQAVASLDATLKSTGNAAGFTSKELQDMASQLQGKTLFGDEATIQAQSLLLTFTDIKKGVYENALPAIQDMATKMAGDGPADLKGATIQVGKALNDPIKGVSALSKVGVSFTESQKATIKTLVDMGDKAGAQKIILAELNKEFGGSAEAARKAGTGGWTSFMNIVGDVQELLGAKLAAGLNRAGNFLSLLVEKSDPVVAVFKEFWNIGSELFDEIMGIAESLGLVSDDAETAGTAIDILVGIFTLLLYPLKLGAELTKALVDGFIAIYNKSELVRGTIGGLAGAFMQLVRNIKENVLNAFGSVADLLVGIFTLDVEKIKSGLKKGFDAVAGSTVGLGKGTADAFAAGYESNKDKVIKVARKTAEEAGEAAIVATKETGKAQKELTEKQLKELEKAHKKHQKELETAGKEFKKASETYELELARLKLELMQEGVDKVLAKLRFQHDQELKELGKHKAEVLANAAATQEEKAALVANLEEQAKLRDAELVRAENEAKTKAHKEDLEAWYAMLDEEEAYALEYRKMQLGTAITAEQELQVHALDLHKANLQQRLDYLILAGDAEKQEAIRVKNEIAKTEKDKTDLIKKNIEDRAMFERDMAGVRLSIGRESTDALLGFLDEESTAWGLFKAIQKTMILAEIGLNLEKELALNAVAAAGNPLNAVTAGAAGATQLLTSNTLSYIRAGISAAKVTAFKKGGSTIPMEVVNGSWQMASGYSGGSIGSFANGGPVNSARLGLIGEAGREWVMPNWMLTSPKYAATAAWLENERRTGGVRAFANGGNTMAEAGGNSSADLSILVAEMQGLRIEFQNVKAWARSLKVDYHAGNAEEVMEIRSESKNRGTW